MFTLNSQNTKHLEWLAPQKNSIKNQYLKFLQHKKLENELLRVQQLTYAYHEQIKQQASGTSEDEQDEEDIEAESKSEEIKENSESNYFVNPEDQTYPEIDEPDIWMILKPPSLKIM